MRSFLVRVALATAVVLTINPSVGFPSDRRTATVKSRAELFTNEKLEHSKATYITKGEGKALEVLDEKGRAVQVQCGEKSGWVDRGDLEFGLPPIEDCRKSGGGSGRGSNECK